MTDRRPIAVFVIGNQSLPRDRRVWQECRSVRDLGFRVIGVSPTGTRPGTETLSSVVEDMAIHRFPAAPSRGGLAGYGRDYATALRHSTRLLRRLAGERRIDVVHVGNPPDLLVLAALPLKRDGTRLIFDQHDPSPEMYLGLSGRRDPVYALLRGLELASFRAADVVISTNESFRRLAVERGGKRPEDVFVVRNGPDLSRFGPVAPDPALKRGKRFLLAYAGVMGHHDGLEHAVRALASLAQRRRDWHATLVGAGEVLPGMQALAGRLGLDDLVEFPGWKTHEEVQRILSAADVCLAPDPPTAANHVSTMIKVIDYMALGRPIVSFALHESVVSAGPAARFVAGDSPERFAGAIDALLDDPQERAAMGAAGVERVRTALAWEHSEAELRRAYERVLGR